MNTNPSATAIHWRGEITGGLFTALVALPVSIALGAFALAPLGASSQALGIVAGIFGTTICAIALALLGGRSTGVNVPRSVSGLFVAALLAQAALDAAVVPLGPKEKLVAVFALLSLAGAIQALLGLLQLGALVKYCPHPVLAGFLNAMAILLLAAQLAPIAGIDEHLGFMELLARLPSEIRPLSVLLAVGTVALMLYPPRFAARVPPMVSGLLIGTAAYHLLAGAGLQGQLGGVLGEMPSVLPRFDIGTDLGLLARHPAFNAILPDLVAGAFSLAIIASLDHLLSAKAFEAQTGVRHDANRELARLGLANAVTAGLGCVPCTISLAASETNHRAGGRSVVSLLVMAAALLVAVLALGPLVALLPHAVVAAMLVVVAFRLVDRPTLALAGKLLRACGPNRRSLAIDVATMAIVAIVAVVAGVAIAVAAGVVLSVAFFLSATSRSVIRREYRADTLQSRRSRPAAEQALLARHGTRIAVFELEGIVFFGTADHLANRIDALLREPSGPPAHVVLDMRRVGYIDLTGANILMQIDTAVRAANAKLLVANLVRDGGMWRFLTDTGVMARLGEAAFFDDTDHALEHAENALIASQQGERTRSAETRLGEVVPLELLDAQELTLLSATLARREIATGEYVFRQGDPGDEMFIIARGSASVYRSGEGRTHRLVTFSQGTVFGEMALLDSSPRSASVRADEPLVCYAMSNAELQRLVAEHHQVAVKLLVSLSRELGRRLRVANQTIESLQA